MVARFYLPGQINPVRFMPHENNPYSPENQILIVFITCGYIFALTNGKTPYIRAIINE